MPEQSVDGKQLQSEVPEHVNKPAPIQSNGSKVLDDILESQRPISDKSGLGFHEASSSKQGKDFPENLSYKNRLQEYTQKLGIPFPTYQTVNEGSPHAPRFRSTVLVEGSYYNSPDTFSHRKAAEKDVARVAFTEITQKMKGEGYSLACKDTVFCKSILNEYAVKMNLDKPIYTTIQPQGSLPVFVSNLVFNSATYTGEAGKNKREAEQLAARAAILSILGNSDSGTVISEIIKIKFKLYAALSKIPDLNNTLNGSTPATVNTRASLGFPLSKCEELEVTGCTNNIPCTGQLRNVPATHQPFHEFKKPKLVASSEAITPPIVFVPPVLEQSLGVGPTSSTRKNNSKNKKAKRKNPA